MNWTLAVTIIGIISTFGLSLVALARTLRQDRRNRAADNLDEIFQGNQILLENYSKDNENLRKRVTELEAEVASIKTEKQIEIDDLITERNGLSHKLLQSQAENAKLIKQLEGA